VERLPIAAYRCEHVDHDRALRACLDGVRSVGWDPPHSAGTKVPRLVADPKRDRPGQDDAQLFVLVPVLRDDAARIELDDAHRYLLAVDHAAGDAVPDLLGCDCGDVVEGAQRRES